VFHEEAARYTFSELQKKWGNWKQHVHPMSLHRIPTMVLTYQQKKKVWEDLWNNESTKLCYIHSRSQLVKYWKEDKDDEINGLDILKK